MLLAIAALTAATLVSPSAAEIATTREVLATADGIYPAAEISSDGRWVLFGDGDAGPIRLFDTTNGSTRTVAVDGAAPVLSGDGRWVAYSKRANGQRDLFLWDRTTGNAQNLSASSLNSGYPSISNDGSVVAWQDAPSDRGDRFIRLWRRSTGQITDFLTEPGLPEVSGDSRYLFYAPDGTSLRRDIGSGVEITLPHFPKNVADDGESYVYTRFEPGFGTGNGIGLHTIGGPLDGPELDIEDEIAVGPLAVHLSGDGSTVFVKSVPDLVPTDSNGTVDTYRWIPATGSLDWLTDRDDTVYDVSSNGRIIVGIGPGQAANSTDLFRSTLPAPTVPLPVPDPVLVTDLAEPQLTEQVNRLYSAFFLRPPDPGGLAFWTDRRSNGWTVSRMADNFVASPEFVDRYGTLTNTEFVDLIYRNLFDRSPDAGGGAFWRGRLDAGMTRGAVMVEFSESPEYIDETGTSAASPGAAHQIWRLYRAYLGRNADQQGFDFWYAEQFNGRSLDSISDAFAASPEFVDKYGALTNEDFIDLIYRDVLGRPPEASGRAFWIAQLDNGRTRGSTMVAFSESPEYIRITNTLPR